MRTLTSLSLLLLVGVGCFADKPAPNPNDTGSDWQQFLGPLGTSVSSEKGIAPWPKQGPRVVWHKPLGIGYGAPAISKGRLFVFDAEDRKARLRCLKSTTGEQFWKFEYASDYQDYYGYDNGPRCCPVVDGDRVYIYGAEGMLHCLGVEDGTVLWKVDTRSKFGVVQNFFGVGAAPVIEGDLLIVQVGGSPPKSDEVEFGLLKSNGSAVVAFDKRSGAVKWQAGDELASYASPVLATIGNRRWCFVFARGGLLGLDPATGKVDFHHKWRAKIIESVNASNPVVAGDQVLLTECYGPGSVLLQMKADGPRVVWSDADKGRQKSFQCHWNTPIFHEGYVYGSSGRHTKEAELRCVELATGKVKWSQPGLDRASLLMVDGHFVCLTEYGDLLLLKVNAEKYDEVSRADLRDADRADLPLLDYPCWAAPVLSHGLLYVRGKGRLVCVELIPRKK
jgi:outer membrane protein assembly factor BamB